MLATSLNNPVKTMESRIYTSWNTWEAGEITSENHRIRDIDEHKTLHEPINGDNREITCEDADLSKYE